MFRETWKRLPRGALKQSRKSTSFVLYIGNMKIMIYSILTEQPDEASRWKWLHIFCVFRATFIFLLVPLIALIKSITINKYNINWIMGPGWFWPISLPPPYHSLLPLPPPPPCTHTKKFSKHHITRYLVMKLLVKKQVKQKKGGGGGGDYGWLYI